jgi:hypothetical protein
MMTVSCRSEPFQTDSLGMPRAVRSRNPADLACIYEPDVNLCIIERAANRELQAFVDALLSSGESIELARSVAFERFDGKDLLPASQRDVSVYHEAWRRDVVGLLRLFCDLFEAEAVGLRLRTLDRPMCPRFHTDFVPARLICTYGGPGTEWLPEFAVDRKRLGKGAGGLADEESGLIRSAGAVEAVPPLYLDSVLHKRQNPRLIIGREVEKSLPP